MFQCNILLFFVPVSHRGRMTAASLWLDYNVVLRLVAKDTLFAPLTPLMKTGVGPGRDQWVLFTPCFTPSLVCLNMLGYFWWSLWLFCPIHFFFVRCLVFDCRRSLVQMNVLLQIPVEIRPPRDKLQWITWGGPQCTAAAQTQDHIRREINMNCKCVWRHSFSSSLSS